MQVDGFVHTESHFLYCEMFSPMSSASPAIYKPPQWKDRNCWHIQQCAQMHTKISFPSSGYHSSTSPQADTCMDQLGPCLFCHAQAGTKYSLGKSFPAKVSS